MVSTAAKLMANKERDKRTKLQSTIRQPEKSIGEQTIKYTHRKNEKTEKRKESVQYGTKTIILFEKMTFKVKTILYEDVLETKT